jgi:predicted nucleotidyltransferase
MESWEPYIEAWRRRRQEEEEADEAARERARADAERIARFLAERYGVRRVLLFGSLVTDRFRPGSDIDLAVEGLEPRRYFRALADAAELTEFPLEIKLVEDLRGLIRERVGAQGEVLYEE